MTLDEWSDFFCALVDETVGAASDHYQVGPRQELGEFAPDGNRTDRVSVPPKKEYRSDDIAQSCRQISAIVQKPVWLVYWLARRRAPIEGTEGSQIHPA